MRKIIFVQTSSNIIPMLTKLNKMGVVHPKYKSGVISKNSEIPEVISKFRDRELDVVVANAQFAATGWSITADDVQIEFEDGFPEGPIKEQCLGRVRPRNLEK